MDKELETYFLVSRCWNSEQLAKKHNMSFGRAVRMLRKARENAMKHKKMVLAGRIEKLITEMVKKQVDDPEVEATG